MNDEEPLGPLEERLATEAQRMLVTAPGQSPFPALQAQFLRRRSQRRIVRTVVAAAALLVVALLITGGREHSEGPRIANVGGTPSESHQPEVSTNSASDGTSDQENFAIERERQGDQRQPPGGLVILIAQVGENGETEYLPGWYVPEQVEVVDSEELSPAERAAAAQLLGADLNTSSEETI